MFLTGLATVMNADPLPGVLLALSVMLIAAKVGGDLAIRIGQPAVLGELAVGILIGNLSLVGIDGLDYIKGEAYIGLLAELGVVLLLFEIGLGSTVRDMMKVGVPALIVAVLGVVTPFALGWGVTSVLLSSASVYVHVFLGATLTATSVGITARVLGDLQRADTAEAHIILGAAVIDDVLGLVVLTTVAAIISAANDHVAIFGLAIAVVLLKAVGFLIGAVIVGGFVSPRLFGAAVRLRGGGVLIVVALVICFLFSYAASAAGLAPIVGAFAAGLVLEPVHYRALAGDKTDLSLESLLSPVTAFLVPVFFVLMGIRIDLASFARP